MQHNTTQYNNTHSQSVSFMEIIMHAIQFTRVSMFDSVAPLMLLLSIYHSYIVHNYRKWIWVLFFFSFFDWNKMYLCFLSERLIPAWQISHISFFLLSINKNVGRFLHRFHTYISNRVTLCTSIFYHSRGSKEKSKEKPV